MKSKLWACSFCKVIIDDYDAHIPNCIAKPRNCRCPEKDQGIHERYCESAEAIANDFASSAVYRISKKPGAPKSSFVAAALTVSAILIIGALMFVYYVWNHS